MAQSFGMLQNSFKHFGQGKFKDAMEELCRFKQLKEQSDANQSMVQVNENIVLCEYCQMRDNSTYIISKLEDISEDIKSKQLKNKKKPEDDTMLLYNKGVILFLSGKGRQAHFILKSLKDVNNLDGFLQLRIYLLLIETSFQLGEYSLIGELYKKLSGEEYLQSLMNKQQLPIQDEQGNEQQQNMYYTSLFFGAEIPFPDASPTNFSKEELQFILNIIKFRLNILSNSKDFKKPLAQLEQAYKSYQNQLDCEIKQNCLSYSPEVKPYLKLHSLMVFKMLKAQKHLSATENINKCIKMLNPYSETNNQQNTDFIQTKQYIYQSFIYNNLGCVHAKMGKYALATIYFQKAIQSLKSQKDNQTMHENIINANMKQKIYQIYQNLADALFMDNKYFKALQIYNQLMEQCAFSAKFWYNRGVCFIQQYHETIPDKNEIHEVVDDILPRYTYDKIEEGAARRVILQTKEVHSDMDEEQQDLQLYKMDQKYEQAIFQQSKQCKDLLSSAIKSFRNALNLLKKEKKDEMIQLDHENIQLPGSILYESSITYLTYALLCRGDFTQALQQAKDALESNLTDNNKYILIQYILECYIQQSRFKEASQFQSSNQISSFITKFLNTNQSLLCRNIVGIQTTTQHHFSPKAIFYYNMAVLNLHNNNPTQGWNSITQLLTAAEINVNQYNQVIPIPILNLLIWYYLKIENVPFALQLIKRRRLMTGPIGKNKISLLNITK